MRIGRACVDTWPLVRGVLPKACCACPANDLVISTRVRSRHGIADCPRPADVGAGPCSGCCGQGRADSGRRTSASDIGPLFYEPTVLVGVTPAMKAYSEETFGPVVSLYPYTS